jgi:hypothetical protein
MFKLTIRNAAGTCGSLGLIFLALVNPICSNAAVIGTMFESTPTLPPAVFTGDFAYRSLQNFFCLPIGCIQAVILGFSPNSIQFAGGNELVTATGSLSTYTVPNYGHGYPIPQINAVFQMTGTLSITYQGRTSATQLGTFPTILTAFDFSGSSNSHTFVTRVAATRTSTSTLSTDPLGGFDVTTGFGAFVESSLDKGPFVQGALGFGLITPEPGSAGMALLGFAGMALAAARQFRCRARPTDSSKTRRSA